MKSGRRKNRNEHKNRLEPFERSQRRKVKQELRNWMEEYNLGERDFEQKEKPVKKKGNTGTGTKLTVGKVCEVTGCKAKRRSNKGAKMELAKKDNKCYICRCDGNGKLQFHHVKPIRCGGETSAKNGRLLCGRCHKRYHELFDGELDRIQGEVEKFVEVFEKQVEKMKKDKK